MTRTVLATASAALAQQVYDATRGDLAALPLGPLPQETSALLAATGGEPLDVVVLDAAGAAEHALALAAHLGQECPTIAVVLVSDEWADLARTALTNGVLDIVRPDASVPELELALGRARHVAQLRAHAALTGAPGNDAASNRGRVISVASPKGGVGKTTVSTNLAVGLAKAAPQSVVLVDLDIQFGDVAHALNLTPEYTLVDAVRPAGHDAMVLKTYLTLHETGLYVICGAENPAEADGINAEDVANLLELLAAEFRYVVVDTAPGMSEHTLVAMDHTNDLVMVTSMDVPGVRGLRKELDTLTDLGMFTDARHIVINFADPSRGLSAADVRGTLGTDVDLLLPLSKAVPVSVNQGVPLLQSGGRGPVTKQLRRLVDRFTSSPVAETRTGPRRSWVGAR
ncbi:AAA family ATPase [Georgenia yuyongxinii]|uniref:AAA family ATPase n=1 Tax=Georgenia yuyongxinii TaxID=2589797 RepID=A0A552WQ74_9MICO|nr:AAA family ATPase [Georgenia yuyongxinii]TRW44932.1 AAA family ATPase [Georgenia yuyongxinii]